MDRSMVQELNGLSSSQFINNRSTFISTAFNGGDYELRKSRIQNLPSYRKEDMSSRVNFVVVFQAIEIERLSSEVEALRIALKDAERQNFNIHNYEVQIRQLTEKCYAYEREREEYRDQIDKLNMICQKLYEELETMKSRFSDIDPTIKEKYRLEKERTQRLEEEMEKWRARYSALETSKNREMEDMKLMMESQRKSMIDREIKELSLKFNSERQNLEKEIRKLRQTLESKDLELKRVNGRVSQLQILNQQLRRYEKTIDEYENKFAMISQETVRLNDLLRHKQEDIERLNGQIGNNKRRFGELERKLREAQEGGEKVRILQDQLRDWRAKYSKIQDQNRDYRQQLNKIPQFKQVIQQINAQSDRLKDVVRQKIGEIDDWKGRYQRVETDFRETKVQQQQKLPVLENKVNQLNTQNDRLNNVLKTRAGEIENWKTKCSDFQRQITRLGTVEQDKKNLQNQLNNQIRQVNELQGNIRQLQTQAKRLGDVERELSNERNQKQQCKKQIDRLNNAVRSTSEKADNFQRKCANLERDLKTFNQIQEELRIYKQKQINLTKQIDRINGIITQKIRQIQALKETFQRIEKGLSQYQGIERKLMDSVNQTQKLIQDLDESRKQAGFLQDKLLASESDGRKLKSDVLALNQQKEQIVRAVNSKTQELEQAKLETSQLQSQIGQLRQKQARLREVEEKLRVTEANLNDLDRKFKSEQNRSRELNQTLEQVSGELNKIKREGMMSPKFKQQFMELRAQSEQREREFRSLQQRITTIENIIKKLREASIKQDQIAKRNTDKFGAIAKQFDASAQAMKKMFELQSQVQRLSEQNLQLEGKVRIMGVENANFKQSFANKGNWESDKDFSAPIDSLGSMGSIGGLTSKRSESASNKIEVPLTKNTSYTTNIITSSNTRYLQPSNNNQSSTVKSPSATNYGFVASQSQSNVSSNTNFNKSQSYMNFDAFKKSTAGSDQFQSEPPRFQFRTSNSKPDL